MHRNLTIAVVEDNANMRRSLFTNLKLSQLFSKITLFPSAEDYLNALKDQRFNLALMDISLPNLDGISAIEKAVELDSSCKTIILSLHDDDEHIFRGICAGASGYLTKPVQAEHLIQAIHDVYDGGTALNPLVASKVVHFFKRFKPQITQDYQLSQQEKRVLSYQVNGLEFKAIAKEMSLSPYTIRAHIRNIYKKLHVNSKAQAVSKALREGLL